MSKQSAEPEPAPARGVQELIARIRDQGVQAAENEAERLLAEASARGRRIVAEAQAEADALKAEARAQLETDRAAAIESLKLAARDTALTLRSRLQDAFRRSVRRLVTRELEDDGLVRELVLELAGRARDAVGERRARILVGSGSSSEEADAATTELLHGLTADMLREGVELVPATDGRVGARVVFVDDDVELDLTDEAVSDLFLKHLLPRFAAMLQDVE